MERVIDARKKPEKSSGWVKDLIQTPSERTVGRDISESLENSTTTASSAHTSNSSAKTAVGMKLEEAQDMKEMEELDKKLATLNKTVEAQMLCTRKEVKGILDIVKSLYERSNYISDLKADLKYKDKLLENFPSISKQLKIYKGLFWGLASILAFYLTVKFL